MFSNNATLAGHVEVGDHVILSGFAGVHQFCRIGAHAFIGMGALVNGDVPPFVMVAHEGYGRPRGINAEGLKRRGFDAERIAAIKRAYRALYMSGANLAEARAELAEIAARQRRRARAARVHRARRTAAAALTRGRGAPCASPWSRAKPPATCSAPA